MSFIDDVVDNWLGDPLGTYEAEAAAKRGAEIQSQASDAGIEEQRRQFDLSQEVLSPYAEAGHSAIQGGLQRFSNLADQGAPVVQGMAGATMPNLNILSKYAQAGIPAFQEQLAIAGQLGAGRQQDSINQVSQSPEMAEMVRQGENAILQNASATGGLRGGNTQAALAQFRPQILNSLLNQKYERLGGLSSVSGNMAQYITGAGGMAAQDLLGTAESATTNIAQLGQSAAAGQASSALQTGNEVSNLLAQKGAARAGGELASGSGRRGTISGAIDIGKLAAGF